VTVSESSSCKAFNITSIELIDNQGWYLVLTWHIRRPGSGVQLPRSSASPGTCHTADSHMENIYYNIGDILAGGAILNVFLFILISFKWLNSLVVDKKNKGIFCNEIKYMNNTEKGKCTMKQYFYHYILIDGWGILLKLITLFFVYT